jgi:spore coat protein U-like protein
MLAFVLPAEPAMAATTTGAITITATLQATCLVSVSALTFGNYSGVVANATATLSVTCTNTTTYNIGLNIGTGAGATIAQRMMTGPSSGVLGYTMSKDVGHTVNWGQTVGTDTTAGTGTGLAQPLTIYGQIPAGQYSAPGSYTDTVTATVTY